MAGCRHSPKRGETYTDSQLVMGSSAATAPPDGCAEAWADQELDQSPHRVHVRPIASQSGDHLPPTMFRQFRNKPPDSGTSLWRDDYPISYNTPCSWDAPQDVYGALAYFPPASAVDEPRLSEHTRDGSGQSPMSPAAADPKLTRSTWTFRTARGFPPRGNLCFRSRRSQAAGRHQASFSGVAVPTSGASTLSGPSAPVRRPPAVC